LAADNRLMANVGPLITPEDVLQAALLTLKLWVPFYLTEVETERGLPENTIQRPKSYHGGVDDKSWIGETMPEVMLLVSPIGEPERPAYLQWYLVDAKVACKGDQAKARAEDEARVQASYLGGALMLLVQQPSLGGLAQDLVMTGSPTLSFPSSDRYVVQANARFQVLTGSVINQEGPKGTVPQIPEEGGGEQSGPPGAPTYIAEKATIAVEAKE
jgi:hypothetical protein